MSRAIPVGIDIGAGTVKIGTLLEAVPGWTGKQVDGYAIIDDIATHEDFMATGRKVQELVANHFGRPSSIAIGCFGPLDLKEKRVINAPNLHGWIGKSFVDWEEIFDQEITLENDANMAAYGEAKVGAGRGFQTVSCFTLGSGIGNGLVKDGAIHHGRWDVEGGHICLDPYGPECGCGQRGCLEAYISTRALRQSYGKEPKEMDDRQDVWEYYAYFLGWACQILAMTVNPDVIVLCGGIAKQRGLLEMTRKQYHSMVRVYPEEAEIPEIATAQHLSRAGVVGAVELAIASSTRSGEAI